MTALACQRSIAAIFLGLGGWCLVFPGHMIDTVFLPEFRDHGRMTHVLVQGFGAQAMLSGVFASFGRWGPRAFAIYSVLLLPFFLFNYWSVWINPIFNNFGLIDLAGNAIMAALCGLGWKRSQNAN